MTTKKKIVFVVNPISGTQGKRAILKWIDERINRTLYDYTIVKTQYAGHAEKIAATAAKEKVDIVVAIGGDGTINEIGRALIHTDTALGIIPCGSGNGLARHLQIPLEPKAAIDIINESSVACIDYGKINNIPFFCTCGVGFDAFVSLKFADSGKRGLLTYLENTLHESLSYKPETYEIENETEDDNGNIFKVASIKIYKDDENGPRYSTEIPLSSLGSSFSVPIGGIIAYTGSLNTLPLNYHICDGTNGTPDLRDRFIVGAGSSYNLNTIGGTSTNILALNQLPNLADFLNKTIAVQGNNQVNGSNNLVSNLPIRAWSWEYFQKNEGNTHGYFKNAFATIPGTSTSFGQPIENKPPYMALYWVMRIK